MGDEHEDEGPATTRAHTARGNYRRNRDRGRLPFPKYPNSRASSSAKVCVLTPEATEKPFYFDPKLVRSDITEGKRGAPLLLTLQTVEAKDCALLQGTRVDVGHPDGLGLYSGYARQETGSTKGETFLRGAQFTGADWKVHF